LAAQRGRRFEPLAGVSILVARIDLTDGAKADIQEVLAFTLERFGTHKFAEYVDLVDDAQRALAAEPTSGKRRPDIAPDAWVYPIGQPGRRARHAFLYAVRDGGQVVEIRALLYDGMDLPNWRRPPP
jgi:toxin ParE1/3/4